MRLRMERQTLRRLAQSGALVLTIGLELNKLKLMDSLGRERHQVGWQVLRRAGQTMQRDTRHGVDGGPCY